MVGQKASLGRIVLVTVEAHTNNGADVAPAVITRAWSDECVNVKILLDSNSIDWKTSIPLFETREELETARQKWAESVNAPASSYRAAYWPPRV